MPWYRVGLMDQEKAIALIQAEAHRAANKFPPFHSAHEGFAVIHEEFDELKAEVWKRDRDKVAMLTEATHLGAMAARFIADLCADGESLELRDDTVGLLHGGVYRGQVCVCGCGLIVDSPEWDAGPPVKINR